MRVCPPDPPLSGRKPAQILPSAEIVFSALRQTSFSGKARSCHTMSFPALPASRPASSGGSCCFWVYPLRGNRAGEADSRCCVGKGKQPTGLGIAGRGAFSSWKLREEISAEPKPLANREALRRQRTRSGRGENPVTRKITDARQLDLF